MKDSQARYEIEGLRERIKTLEDRHWTLVQRFNRLLEHQGLTEVEQPSKTIIQPLKCEQ